MARGRKRLLLGGFATVASLLTFAAIAASARWRYAFNSGHYASVPLAGSPSNGIWMGRGIALDRGRLWVRLVDNAPDDPPPAADQFEITRNTPVSFDLLLSEDGLQQSEAVAQLLEHGRSGSAGRMVCWTLAPRCWTVLLVLWPAPAFTLLAGTALLLSGLVRLRRTRTGRCHHCGYDLTATLPTSPCPECGTPREQTAPLPRPH